MNKLASDRANTNWRSARRRLARRDPMVADILASVADAYDIPVDMLLASSRCRANIASARRMAMYLMHVVLGRSPTTIARLFRRHASTVMRACYAIEDRRDDRAFDALVSGFEHALTPSSDAQTIVAREHEHVAS